MAKSESTRTAESGGKVENYHLVGPRPISRHALSGVQIPSKDAKIRRLVVDLYTSCPWLSRSDVFSATRWAVLGTKFRSASEVLDRYPDGGVITQSGEPRKLLAELRALSAELSRLENQMGVSAVARSNLGVNLTRMQDLATLMSEAE